MPSPHHRLIWLACFILQSEKWSFLLHTGPLAVFRPRRRPYPLLIEESLSNAKSSNGLPANQLGPLSSSYAFVYWHLYKVLQVGISLHLFLVIPIVYKYSWVSDLTWILRHRDCQCSQGQLYWPEESSIQWKYYIGCGEHYLFPNSLHWEACTSRVSDPCQEGQRTIRPGKPVRLVWSELPRLASHSEHCQRLKTDLAWAKWLSPKGQW